MIRLRWNAPAEPTSREETQMADPPVVSRDEWLAARNGLLAHEKELTHHRDEVNAERSRVKEAPAVVRLAVENPTLEGGGNVRNHSISIRAAASHRGLVADAEVV